jgi:ABC-type anion transport system, duplicated permease component
MNSPLSKRTYSKNEATTWSTPNHWDILAITAILLIILLIVWGTKQMAVSYHLGDIIPISLKPKYLPTYALRTTIRLFIAMFFSIVFTFTVGTLAAKNNQAEKIIIPIIDALQSVPVLSFLSITITGFIALFKNSMLGPECAAIFGILTSQVWNMILGFYQGIKTVPKDLIEAAEVFHLSSWQCFWKVEVPFAMPSLLWNIMISMSGSWFFVIACEAFSVAGENITLPGIGSYIALAITNANYQAVGYAILCMFAVILLYDQILFRPLTFWIEKFRETTEEEEKAPKPWLIAFFQKTNLLPLVISYLRTVSDFLINFRFKKNTFRSGYPDNDNHLTFGKLFYWLILAILITGLIVASRRIFINISSTEIKWVLLLGIFTGTRVMILVLLASIIWVPIGVWIGFRPKLVAVTQPLIQFAAAFPANLLFPVATAFIIKFNLNVEIWVAPLMILGTQWYILFNVIAGTTQIPKELRLAVNNLGVKGWLWWYKFILPSIAPYYLTGAITAAGGAWNASIIAEIVDWGKIRLCATGIGSYIKINFEAGDFPRIALGTIIMCLLVLLINRLFWKPLYNIAIIQTETESD